MCLATQGPCKERQIDGTGNWSIFKNGLTFVSLGSVCDKNQSFVRDRSASKPRLFLDDSDKQISGVLCPTLVSSCQ